MEFSSEFWLLSFHYLFPFISIHPPPITPIFPRHLGHFPPPPSSRNTSACPKFPPIIRTAVFPASQDSSSSSSSSRSTRKWPQTENVFSPLVSIPLPSACCTSYIYKRTQFLSSFLPSFSLSLSFSAINRKTRRFQLP